MSVDVTLLEECLLEHLEVNMVKCVDPKHQCKIFQYLQRDMIPNHGLLAINMDPQRLRATGVCVFPSVHKI